MLTLKLLFKLALRQARGLVCSLLKLPGLEWPAPCFSTVSRRQATLTVTIPVRRRTEPLHPLVDSTGLNICGEGEWKVKKHGTEYRRTWRKVHLAIDAETLDVRAVEMTGHRQGDTTQAEELLSQLDPAELLASVSGDGAYDTRGFFYREVHSRGPRSSCHHDGTASRGKTGPISLKPGMPSWLQPGIQGGGYGRSGAVTTGEAWSRPPWTFQIVG
ncbi:Transposase [Laribacter hongkongensis HLHK9]|uniref:Transposase n=1 Tax=Laribacter hongkongensis (strain HLHK9) TaxID=557598 RepID=C1DBW9_LARHH|nr:Transposase [Laribacter hongkongensis HLHK9]